jgi:hypothetical protein
MKDINTEPNDYICPFFDVCDFIRNNEEKMPDLICKTKNQYCTRKEVQCARRRVYETLGVSLTPPLMLPGQALWARQIIEEYQADPEAYKKTVSVQ